MDTNWILKLISDMRINSRITIGKAEIYKEYEGWRVSNNSSYSPGILYYYPSTTCRKIEEINK